MKEKNGYIGLHKNLTLCSEKEPVKRMKDEQQNSLIPTVREKHNSIRKIGKRRKLHQGRYMDGR